ncbi:MAG: indole-3-glycerol-phosphate synthase [Thermaerobacter sp.]|nr:indole-3-glycerol-phosphate synthase [Thermaerobacter sp.]
MNHLDRLATAQRDAFLRRTAAFPARPDPVRPFLVSEGGPPALIAEFKRSSPSHGAFLKVGRAEQLRRYAEIGASAVSVLVAGEGFRGDVEDLRRARQETDLPLLYKGFVSLKEQIDEAYAYGADAVLLIAAVLQEEFPAFLAHAHDRGLAALCEVHDALELEAVCAAGARIVGINNRDLRTLDVDTSRFLALAPKAPRGTRLIAESGYRTRRAVHEAITAGARGVLVGEALLAGSELQAPWAEVLRDVG